MTTTVSSKNIKIEAEDLLLSDRLSQTIMNATAAILVRMDTWTIVYATKKAARLFGYMPGELDGKALALLIPDDKKMMHENHVRQFVENPEGRPMGTTGMVLRAKRRMGELIPVAISLEPEVIQGVPMVTANVLLTHE